MDSLLFGLEVGNAAIPWLAFLAGALTLGVTIAYLLAQPGRTARLALVSGALVHLELVLARALVYSPEQWSAVDNPRLLRIGTHLLGTWLLIGVAMAYRRLRRDSQHPLRWVFGALVPSVALSLGLLLLEAYLGGRYLEAWIGLPYDLALAVVAFGGPPLTFEFLAASDLWRERGQE